MKNLISQDLLNIVINLEYLIEGQSGEKFDIKHKVLHLISKKEKTTPTELIEVLNMARSNLAIICNNLVKQGFITKIKEPLNKKEIYYSITPQGTEELEKKFEKVEENLKKLRNKTKITKLSKELEKLI